MKVTARIIDFESREPLDYTNVTLSKSEYEEDDLPGEVYMADESGVANFSSPALDKPGVFIKVSAAGYEPEMFYPGEFHGDIELKRRGALAGITVNSKKTKLPTPKPKKSLLVPVTIAAGIALIAGISWWTWGPKS